MSTQAKQTSMTETQKAEINRTIDQMLSTVQLLCRSVDRPSPIVTREERRAKEKR